MGKPIFAICDDNEMYAGKIYEFIHNKKSESYEVALFTDVDSFEKYSVGKEVEIGLISTAFKAFLKNGISIKHLFLLTETLEYGIEGYNSIYRYQSGTEILKKINQFCSETSTSVTRRNCKKPLNIIGVYSPIKKSFQTTFSIALGQILSQKAKSLYINFECFSGFDYLMSEKNKADLMDLIYFWQLGNANFTYRLGSVIEQIGGLDYVPPVHSFVNYEGISGEEWLNFIQAFEEYTDYEYLILDLSESVNGLLDVLRKCRTVYTITDEKRISRAKIAQYEALLEEYQYDDVLNKTQKMNLPYFREIPDEFMLLPYSELSEFIRKELKFEADYRNENKEVYGE